MAGLIADVAIVIAVAVLVGFYVSWRASRLDRLHARIETARAVLDAALVRRSAVALEFAASGLLDPATSLLLAGVAHDARSAVPPTDGMSDAPDPRPSQSALAEQRELAESNLSRTLRATFNQPDFRASLMGRDGAEELLAELEAAANRVFLARKFYNDAVVVTRAARRRRLVRLLRLAGGAPMPPFFEIDDAPPAAGQADDGSDMPHLTG